ncbi:MAG: pyruvate kinase [Planctomycetota bacterium]
MSARPRAEVLRELHSDLARLRSSARALEAEHAADLESIPSSHQRSARNLLHYLALRRVDLRAQQLELARLGLSSLGRAESHVMESVDAVLLALSRLAGDDWQLDEAPTPPFDEDSTIGVLEARADALLGGCPRERGVRIMVTMPSSAARDPALVRELLLAGMDLARINAAHDEPATWERIAANVRQQAEELGRSCRVMVDLPGPKLRTASLGEGPHVVRLKPSRDERGRVVEPLRVRFARADAAEPGAIAIDDELIAVARVGDTLRAIDASGDKRVLQVIATSTDGLLATCEHTLRLESGNPLRLRRNGETVARGTIGALPALDTSFDLHAGDRIRVVPEGTPPRPPRRDSDGALIEPAVVPTTLGDALTKVRAGQAIRFDDGRIGGVVETVDTSGLVVRIESVPPGGASLRGDKGINLPDSELTIAFPTAEDLAALDFAVGHAAAVGMSFVQTPADVLRLQSELEGRGGGHLGVVLKIETRRAFRNLPALILTGMRSPLLGVMVARGDLAVEVGFARLAEVQEEILWLCEAALVPVIWATQVLEGLAKSGMPSRAELTDAAMSVRSECVMLNKGPYVVDAVRLLDDVLRRMRTHHQKKRALLRPLSIAWPEDRSS